MMVKIYMMVKIFLKAKTNAFFGLKAMLEKISLNKQFSTRNLFCDMLCRTTCDMVNLQLDLLLVL